MHTIRLDFARFFVAHLASSCCPGAGREPVDFIVVGRRRALFVPADGSISEAVGRPPDKGVFVNRIGDSCYPGMLIPVHAFGTLDFRSWDAVLLDCADPATWAGAGVLTLATGSVGSPSVRRFFLLFVWLPDAMKAPAVSALIHAATW